MGSYLYRLSENTNSQGRKKEVYFAKEVYEYLVITLSPLTWYNAAAFHMSHILSPL
ncbi:MAG: hypothetical protein QG591_2346 [Planctomycetota bacterium]|nr:hypothetical protein [Planctomycetota bacterium]